MNKSFFILSIFTIFVLASCNRKGCTDVDAQNYNSKSKKDDFTCSYIGDANIWFDQVKSQEFADSSIAVVYYFIDDEAFGSKDILSYTSTPPSCNSPKGQTINKKLKSKKTKEFDLEVREADGTVISAHEITINANACTPFQLPN